MTQHLFRHPIDLFPDVDLTQYGVRFGFEFEMILNGERSHTCGSDRMREVSPSLMALVGGTVCNHTTEYGEHRDDGYEEWHFTGDGSLDTNDEDDNGTPLELVSPIFTAAEVCSKLDSVYSWANAKECGNPLAYTNDSCGLHIGVSADNIQYGSFDALLFSLLVDDHAVLAHCGRLDNSYANPYYHRFMEVHASEVRSALNATDFRERIALLSRSGHLQGRWSVHASKIQECGYMEYRSPGGDWLSYDLAYMHELVRKIGTAYLVAAGKVTHPLLESIYNSRMRYATASNRSSSPREALFPAGAQFDIPSIVDSLSHGSINLRVGSTHLHFDGSFFTLCAASRTERALAFLHEGVASAHLKIRTHQNGEFSPYMVTNNHQRDSHVSALRWLKDLREFAASHDPEQLTALVRDLLRTAIPALTAAELSTATDKVVGPYLTLLARIKENPYAFSRAQRSSLHAGWMQTVSSRVRLRALNNSRTALRSFIDATPSISDSMASLACRIADAACSAGAPLSDIALTSLVNSAGYSYPNNPNSMLLAQDLRACSVFQFNNNPRSALDFIRSRTMDFISPDLTASVFSQQTDCSDYVALRNHLGNLVCGGLNTNDADYCTRQIRAAMVDVGTCLAGSLRRVWAVTGSASVLRTKITGAAMRRVLLGSV